MRATEGVQPESKNGDPIHPLLRTQGGAGEYTCATADEVATVNVSRKYS